MKILIVEDDTLLLQGLILAAQTEGYACDGVTTARMAEQSLEAGHYSLVVLDLGLPDEDGLHFLARIRQKKYTLPVLILTARDTLTDKIAGLDVGADDYLVKPFALEELHARIRALLRRHNNQGESELIVGNLTLNMGRRQVWMGGEELILTPKEYALLSRLMLKAGSPVHREILYNDIYNWDNEPSTNTLEVHIHNLRDYTEDKYRRVDDYPFGGFAGMVMKIEPIERCINALKAERDYDEVIFTTPDGEQFNQPMANSLSLAQNLIILCGHFKGIDYRIREHLITKEISIGDYVLTGGELAAAVMADAIVRIIPGVISDEQSALSDSFQDNLLAAPVYTRPADYKGWKVPDILLSGHEAKIKEWELQQSLERTKKLRPDLLED